MPEKMGISQETAEELKTRDILTKILGLLRVQAAQKGIKIVVNDEHYGVNGRMGIQAQ